jgi:hypothetical protein
MGLLANTVSISQFRVVGDLPPVDLRDWVAEQLNRHAFRSIEEGIEELAVGWVTADDHQATDFTIPRSCRFDHYLLFTLRKDQRRVPAPLLKAYQRVAEQEFLAANPSFFRVPKQKREDIRDAVKLRLLARTLPSPATCDVLWDTRSGMVTLASVSGPMVDLFESEFKKCFPGLRPVAVHPYARAEMAVPEALRPALEQANLATADTVLDLVRANLWLGRELLLWLLHRTLTGSGDYHVCRPGPAGAGELFTAWLNDRLVLQLANDEGTQKITVAGAQSRFQEVLAALREGKQISEATIHLEKDDQSWRLTLKGELFRFGSFKAPSVQLERDNTVDRDLEREALVFERMHLLETGLQLFDSLLVRFLEDRLGGSWPAALARIESWLAEEA